MKLSQAVSAIVIIEILSVSIAIPVQDEINKNFIEGQNISALRKHEIDEDAKLTVQELIVKYGYPVESHFATTPDGYILQVVRIPHGKKNVAPKNKVVFLMHGLLSSAADWIMSGPNHALAYILADEGYDVWMGNSRGNKLSRNHTHLDPDKDAGVFWSFTWHEIGSVDLPTMIDYVLAHTNKEKLYYVGHSQGTTSFFVMASQLPEYNKKIQAQVSLAPIAFMNHMTSPLMHILAFWHKPLSLLLPMIGVNEFIPSSDFITLAGDVFCRDNEITQVLCTNVLFVLCGYSYGEMNGTMLPILMGHTPAGGSSKQFLHYGQEIMSGHFRQYDYGFFGNINRYGSIHPPEYKLNQVTAPVYLLYSHNDWLASEIDVVKLCQKIRNCRGKFLVSENNFNHLDYMYGKSAKKYAYDKIISIFARH